MSLYELERNGDVDALRGYLDSDSDSVRERAAETLGDVADPTVTSDLAVITDLVEVATTDEHPDVRGAAIDALAELGELARLLEERIDVDPDGADWVAADAYVDALSADLPELRMAAANAMAGIAEPRAVTALVDCLDDPDERVRVRISRALGNLGDPRAVEGLADRLEDPTVSVRREAASALAALDADDATAALLEGVDDDSPAVRRVAVSALGESGDIAVIDALVGALEDERDAVRRASVYSVIQLLSSVPTDRSHEARETVVDRLSTVDAAGVVEPMIEILARSSRTAQRRNAAWLLGRIDASDADDVVAALVEALDDDRMVARFAATSLAELGGVAVEDAALQALDSESSQRRARAAFVLGRVGGPRSRERLQSLVQDTDDEAVRERAFAALSKLGAHEVRGGESP